MSYHARITDRDHEEKEKGEERGREGAWGRRLMTDQEHVLSEIPSQDARLLEEK